MNNITIPSDMKFNYIQITCVHSQFHIELMCIRRKHARIQRVATRLWSVRGAVKCDELLRFIGIHVRRAYLFPIPSSITPGSFCAHGTPSPAPVAFLDLKRFLVTPGTHVSLAVTATGRLAFSASIWPAYLRPGLHLAAIHWNSASMHWSLDESTLDTRIIPRRAAPDVCPRTQATRFVAPVATFGARQLLAGG